MEELDNILADGHLAFYRSAEVVQLFLLKKGSAAPIHLFMLVVFEGLPFAQREKIFMGKPIELNASYKLGIQRYHLSIDEAKLMLSGLANNGKWDLDSDDSLVLPVLKSLPKQYVPGNGNRLCNVLKNNFHGGSYLLEFFDEQKAEIDFLLTADGTGSLDKVIKTLLSYFPIDLGQVLDRLGNIIVQCPITVLDMQAKALPTWDGVNIEFAWHQQLAEVPHCLLQVESSLDGQLTGATIETYNGQAVQQVKIGSIDQVNLIRIWRTDPSLILSSYSGGYVRDFQFNINVMQSSPRSFFVDGNYTLVDIHENGNEPPPAPMRYDHFITSRRDEAEKKKLEANLSFKQYRGIALNDALEDLRRLIRSYGSKGIMIWDPFLSGADLLRTVFHSTTVGAPIRAIGSVTKTVRQVYGQKGMSVPEIITGHRNILNHRANNPLGLNLEFRLQHDVHGWAFHDRFMAFLDDELSPPRVYSLGTSLNSFGHDHHILQLVSHPKPIIAEFERLWAALNHPDCFVWKSPNL